MQVPHSQLDSRRRGIDVKMTPMIDVVFLLLIFFVCTASFQLAEEVLPTGLLASLGAADPMEIELDPELERVIVKLRQEGETMEWLVSERAYGSLAETAQVLRAVARIDPTVVVILDIDGAVPLSHVVDLYDLCRLVGFETIQLAASVEL